MGIDKDDQIHPLELDALAGSAFHVVPASNRSNILFSGTIQKRTDLENDFSPDTRRQDFIRDRVNGNYAGSDVRECDFSSFSTPGEYVIVVEGMGCSFPFELADDAYEDPFYLTTRMLYLQRAGIEIESAYAGQWARPRSLHYDDIDIKLVDRRPMDYQNAEGVDASINDDVIGDFDTYGWYRDAGDWDGYSRHLPIPIMLMTAYEAAPDNFSDNQLNIPESGNGIPDILDEARWIVDFLRRNKALRGNGGVPGGRVYADPVNFAPTVNGCLDCVPSWEDNRTWYILKEDPFVTFLYAGMATQLAYNLNQASGGTHPESSALLADAQEAYNWAQNNLQSGDLTTIVDNFMRVKDVRMYAAAWLYKYTGNNNYQQQYRADNDINSGTADLWVWGQLDQRYALWAYTTTNRGSIDASLKATHIEAVKNNAIKHVTGPAEGRSFRVGYEWEAPMNIGTGSSTPKVMDAIVPYSLATSDTERDFYLRAIQTTADFHLGANPTNYCWITRADLIGGERSPGQAFARDYWYDSNPNNDLIPGAVLYAIQPQSDYYYNPFNPNDPDYGWLNRSPNLASWPLYEGYSENRYNIFSNEYTVDLTIAVASAVYGFLSGVGSNTSPVAPQVSITSPTANSTFNTNATVSITADASGQGSTIDRVEFHANGNLLGQDDSAPFAYSWSGMAAGAYSITAKAVTANGQETTSSGVTVTIQAPRRTAGSPYTSKPKKHS